MSEKDDFGYLRSGENLRDKIIIGLPNEQPLLTKESEQLYTDAEVKTAMEDLYNEAQGYRARREEDVRESVEAAKTYISK